MSLKLKTPCKQKYDLNNTPKRDRIILRPYQDIYEFMNAMPEFIQEKSSAYNIYFYTITFKNPARELPYRFYQEYFNLQRQKLDNALLPNSSAYHKKPYLIIIPEEYPSLHFHGLLLIHKSTHEKFIRKCVDDIEQEFIVKLKTFKNSIRLKNNIINPYTKSIKLQKIQSAAIRDKKYKNRSSREKASLLKIQPTLSVDSYRIHQIEDLQEFYATSLYSNKESIKSRFSYDDIIIECKDRSKQNIQSQLSKYIKLMFAMMINIPKTFDEVRLQSALLKHALEKVQYFQKQ